MNLQNITRHYAVAALWTSEGDNGDPLDDRYDVSDFDATAYASMLEDVTNFVTANYNLLTLSGQEEGQIGHDFWLTRNGHGAGFWDRGLGEVGEELTRACKAYGEIDLYEHEGRVYQ